MKKPVIFLSIALLISTVFAARERYLHLGYKKQLIHHATVSQMDAIDDRARAFMEHEFGTSHVSGGRGYSFLEKYSIELLVPEEKRSEFKEWMSGVNFQSVSVDRFPNAHGSSVDHGQEKMIFRVYYGNKPEEW